MTQSGEPQISNESKPENHTFNPFRTLLPVDTASFLFLINWRVSKDHRKYVSVVVTKVQGPRSTNNIKLNRKCAGLISYLSRLATSLDEAIFLKCNGQMLSFFITVLAFLQWLRGIHFALENIDHNSALNFEGQNTRRL